jgi:hypothetical protein
MNESGRPAVLLSDASQDAEAAQRVAAALRASAATKLRAVRLILPKAAGETARA